METRMLQMHEYVSTNAELQACMDYALSWLKNHGVTGFRGRVKACLDYLEDDLETVKMESRVITVHSELPVWHVIAEILHAMIHLWMKDHGMDSSYEGLTQLTKREFLLELGTRAAHREIWGIEHHQEDEYRIPLARCITAARAAGGYRNYMTRVAHTHRL